MQKKMKVCDSSFGASSQLVLEQFEGWHVIDTINSSIISLKAEKLLILLVLILAVEMLNNVYLVMMAGVEGFIKHFITIRSINSKNWNVQKVKSQQQKLKGYTKSLNHTIHTGIILIAGTLRFKNDDLLQEQA